MVCSERFVITNCDLIMFSIKRPMAAHVCMYDVVTRASDYGWQDTYVLTKAMGEMVIESMRDDLPTVIVRPSIVESSFRDPFPGWIEGNRYILPSLAYIFYIHHWTNNRDHYKSLELITFLSEHKDGGSLRNIIWERSTLRLPVGSKLSSWCG